MKKFHLGNYNLEPVYLYEMVFADNVMIVASSAETLQFNLKVWYEELPNENNDHQQETIETV